MFLIDNPVAYILTSFLQLTGTKILNKHLDNQCNHAFYVDMLFQFFRCCLFCMSMWWVWVACIIVTVDTDMLQFVWVGIYSVLNFKNYIAVHVSPKQVIGQRHQQLLDTSFVSVFILLIQACSKFDVYFVLHITRLILEIHVWRLPYHCCGIVTKTTMIDSNFPELTCNL